MAALLHQAALQPPHTRASSLAPPPRAGAAAQLSRRRRRAAAPTIRSAATDSSAVGTDEVPSKKMTRKEKQLDRRRQQDMQQRQEQLVLEATSTSPPATKPGGGGGEEEDDDELPQTVFDRILGRIMFTVGVPMASGVALLNVYDALKRGQGVEVPPWLPLLTLLLAFGTSALGIAYGTLSASWDPDREGSLLGIDEARANWPVLWKEEIEKEKAKAAKQQRKKK